MFTVSPRRHMRMVDDAWVLVGSAEREREEDVLATHPEPSWHTIHHANRQLQESQGGVHPTYPLLGENGAPHPTRQTVPATAATTLGAWPLLPPFPPLGRCRMAGDLATRGAPLTTQGDHGGVHGMYAWVQALAPTWGSRTAGGWDRF
jgi:hypothetical protein